VTWLDAPHTPATPCAECDLEITDLATDAHDHHDDDCPWLYGDAIACSCIGRVHLSCCPTCRENG